MAQDFSRIYPEVISVLCLPSVYCYVISHLHALVHCGYLSGQKSHSHSIFFNDCLVYNVRRSFD